MDGVARDGLHLFSEDDERDPFVNSAEPNESTKVYQKEHRVFGNFSKSLMKFINISLQLSVICGILNGLVTTLLWWIELNVTHYCIGSWKSIPGRIHRVHLVVDSFEAIIILVWPFLTIAPICSWSMIKESNVLFWCTIAGLVDVIDRLCLYIFGYYGEDWKSYVGNVLFLGISFIVFYKFVAHRQQLSNENRNRIGITLRLLLQIVIGLLISLPYNYLFLKFYEASSPLIRIVLSCSLIAIFYVPKLIISFVITNINGIFEPDEGIVFAAGFLILTTMVTRLTQAGIESLPYFTLISLVHGVCNVVEKVVLPARRKIINLICRRKRHVMDETWIYTQQYIAHQALISIITETSSVIMSNAAAYLIVYYYKKEESTGKRYSGFFLCKEMVLRSVIAMSIEWIFNIGALYILNTRCNIPVLHLWKCQWKSIMIIHVIQVIVVVVYFAHYVNATLLGDAMHNSTEVCVGSFRRL